MEDDNQSKPMQNAMDILVKIAKRKGNNFHGVFVSFLDYIIALGQCWKGFRCLEGYDIELGDLAQEWFKAVCIESEKKGWYDGLGILYESVIMNSGTKKAGASFYTPEAVCELLTGITASDLPDKGWISDPTCGTGRTLLSLHASNPALKCRGEDLDETACKVCTCNFYIHAIEGIVICHDVLEQRPVRFVFKVNEGLNDRKSMFYGVPHIERIDGKEAEKFI